MEGRVSHTNVNDVPTTARVETEGSTTFRALARVEMADVLVEAGLVGDVGAAQLQHALALEGVLEGLVTNDTAAADEGALSAPRVDAVNVQHAGHASPSPALAGEMEGVGLPGGCVTLGAGDWP